MNKSNLGIGTETSKGRVARPEDWNPVSDKSRAGALIVCLFLGPLGIHRMYVGKVVSGLIMLLMTFTGVAFFIAGIWSIIDFISIALGQFRDKENRILTKW